MPATRSPTGASGDAGASDDLLPGRLTDAQRRAVTHTGGPLLVVAGPGAGKTSVMVRRAAWLVLEHGVDPGSLLVTTFNNEAAEELFDRLHRFLGARTDDVHISTLHAFCGTVLERSPLARGCLASRTPPRRSRSTGRWPGPTAAPGSCSARRAGSTSRRSRAWPGRVLFDEELHENTGKGEERGPSGAGGRDGGEDAPGPTLPLDGRGPPVAGEVLHLDPALAMVSEAPVTMINRTVSA